MSKLYCSVIIGFVLSLAACSGGGGRTKGGGDKGAGAVGSGQQSGRNASSGKDQGTMKGEVYDGVTCDAATEGLAWCDSDSEIVFCSGGEWWLLDCADPEIGLDVCGEDEDTIDCYASEDL